MLTSICELPLQQFRLDLQLLVEGLLPVPISAHVRHRAQRQGIQPGDLLPDDGSQLQHLLPQIVYVSKTNLPIRHQQNGI